jgi:hypothetical protein
MVGIKLSVRLLLLLTKVPGPVVRTAPNDLSFATPSSTKDIYKSRVPFPKTKFFAAIEDGFQFAGVGTEIDVERHLRERKLLNAAFTLRAIREYEPLVVQHLDQFLDVIGQKGKTLEGVNSCAFCLLPCQSPATWWLAGLSTGGNACRGAPGFVMARSTTSICCPRPVQPLLDRVRWAPYSSGTGRTGTRSLFVRGRPLDPSVAAPGEGNSVFRGTAT